MDDTISVPGVLVPIPNRTIGADELEYIGDTDGVNGAQFVAQAMDYD